MQNNNSKQYKNQKGIVSIFTTMMIMTILLTMVLGLIIIFVEHLKIITGMGNSVVAFHAANSGIERLLYEDRKCRQKTEPCSLPCASDCFGLASSPPTEFTKILINGADYRARFSIHGGRDYFESIGTFEEARRAIRVAR